MAEDGQASAQAPQPMHFMLNVPAVSVLSGKIDYDSIDIIGYSQGGVGEICAVTNYENGACRSKMGFAVTGVF